MDRVNSAFKQIHNFLDKKRPSVNIGEGISIPEPHCDSLPSGCLSRLILHNTFIEL